MTTRQILQRCGWAVGVAALTTLSIAGCATETTGNIPSSPDASRSSPVPSSTGTQTGSPSSPPLTASGSPAPCQSSDLSVSQGLSAESPLGLVVITFKNVSDAGCTLEGYATIQVEDSKGIVVSEQEKKDDIADKQIMVEPGAEAYEFVHYLSSRNLDGKSTGCTATDDGALTFLITVPGDPTTIKVPSGGVPLCANQHFLVWRFMPTVETLGLS